MDNIGKDRRLDRWVDAAPACLRGPYELAGGAGKNKPDNGAIARLTCQIKQIILIQQWVEIKSV